VRRFFQRVGFAFIIAAAGISILLHIATFVTAVPPVWLLPSFGLVFGGVACSKPAGGHPPLVLPSPRTGLLSIVLFAYAALTFVYVYRMTGGATSVKILDGQYVSMYQDRVISTISEHEYRWFPSLWTRVMSAWLGMVALLGLTNLAEDRS
jgi:hypothetical protein